MKKIIGPLLIILAIGGIVAGVLIVNRNIKHKDEVNEYKKTLKGIMESLSKDANDVEKGLEDTLTAWEVTSRGYGNATVEKGALEDVLNQAEHKAQRDTLLGQLKTRSKDSANILKKAENYPKGERAMYEDFRAYWNNYCQMADMYSNITLVNSYEGARASLAEMRTKNSEYYDKIMKTLKE